MKEFKHILIVGALLVLPHFLSAQVEDTTKVDSLKIHLVDPNHLTELPKVYVKDPIHSTLTIDEIKVNITPLRIHKIRKYRPLEYVIGQKAIEEMAPDDVGDVVAKLPSVVVKSHGALGGLKTVSFHSLGSGHTSVVVDGFALENAQAGQVNLAQLQGDGVVRASIHSGIGSNISAPVSSIVSGNTLFVGTIGRYYRTDKSQLKANVKYGSFNRQDIYLAGSYLTHKKWSFSGFAKYRKADGDYKYKFMNGLTQMDGVRQNNDYHDLYVGVRANYKVKNRHPLSFGYRGSLIDQGLPGAVLLYNETADERLNTMDHTLYGDFFRSKNNVTIRIYGTANQNNLKYTDPTFFNNAGNVEVDYQNQSAVLGASFQKYEYQKFNFMGGLEETVSTLVSSDSSLSNPIRFHTKGFIKGHKDYGIGVFKIMLTGQYVDENTRIGNSSNNMFRLNPVFEFDSREVRKLKFKHHFHYKNSFRMPSFNELYYNNVGNSDLLPESANQFLYSIRMIPYELDDKDLFIRASAYFNKVDNKIIAIPTKNLFVWSMQNVTNVNIFGGDVFVEYFWGKRNIKYNLMTNYTYQKAIDVTEGSLNQGDQVAYTPEHMANLDFSIEVKKINFRISNNFTGSRYALNENIESNLVKAYLTTDFSVNYSFQMKKEQKLKVQANVKNVFNQSYAYVRSFVMPGRNFLISLSYALN